MQKPREKLLGERSLRAQTTIFVIHSITSLMPWLDNNEVHIRLDVLV